MMNEINENSTAILTLSFLDEEGDGVIPSSATYRIDDVASKDSIVVDTVFTPSASIHEITITDEQNAMLSNNPSEVHEVTVEFDYSGDKHGTNSFFITILNLTYVTR